MQKTAVFKDFLYRFPYLSAFKNVKSAYLNAYLIQTFRFCTTPFAYLNAYLTAYLTPLSGIKKGKQAASPQ